MTAQTTLADVLSTLAHHAACLRADSVMTACGLSAEDGTSVLVKVRIKKRTGLFEDADPVWDTVYLNGECCGNRCGGVRRLAELYAPVIAAQARIDADRASEAVAS